MSEKNNIIHFIDRNSHIPYVRSYLNHATDPIVYIFDCFNRSDYTILSDGLISGYIVDYLVEVDRINCKNCIYFKIRIYS